MGKITITSSKLNKTFTYENENLLITGNYQVDSQSGELQNVQGSAYRNQSGEQGQYIGNFNGYSRDGEIKYSVTDMTRRDSAMVWDAIDEIEAYILGGN